MVMDLKIKVPPSLAYILVKKSEAIGEVFPFEYFHVLLT